MKCRNLLVVLGAAGLFFSANAAHAQSSLFTYQGRLIGTNGQPANGSYDFQFQLLNAANGNVGLPLTNAPVAVSNGLFTTALDFGASALDGTPRFLQIGVRTNGSTNAYAILSPTQPLTSAPYAYRADVASTFPGAIADSQLSTNIPLLNGNPVFTGTVTLNHGNGVFSGTLSGTFNGNASGTFSGSSSGTFSGTASGTINGNGAGLTNVNITNVVGIVPGSAIWQIVQTTTQQGQSDYSYLTTNAAQTTLILPVNPGVGDTLRISGAGAGGWKIAQNAGQTILTGVLGLPAGVAWTTNTSTSGQAWQAVASSANGTRMVAAVGGSGYIWTSTDSGKTWTQQSGSGLRAWHSVASSADGTRLAAVVDNGYIYTSVDSGSSWTQRASSLAWFSIASSADGTKLAAVVDNGYIYTSADSGSNWTQRASSLPWYSIACSADGTKLVAVCDNERIYTSTDSGVTWINRTTTSQPWYSVASSADGIHLVAVGFEGQIYTSEDSGVTWLPRTTGTQPWQSVACSGDGTIMIAVINVGQIYSSFDSGQTWTPRGPTSNPAWQCVACSSDGTRAIAAVGGSGAIYNSASTTSVGTAGYLTGIQYSAIELQYIGGGQWMPLSFVGKFSAN